MLICLEASEADAERHRAGRATLRLFRGYDESDPRPPTARALDLARGSSASASTGSGSSSASARRRPTGWSASRRRSEGVVRRLCRTRPTRRRSSPPPARSRPTQEIERMRLANEIAAGAMEHVRAGSGPGCARARSARCGTAASTTTGTGYDGKVELAHGFSLVWSGAGIRTFTATGNRPIQEHEPTLFEIWVCADGYWCDHTKNLFPGELTERYARARAAAARRLQRRGRRTAARARASPSSTGRSATGSRRRATPASRPIRSATASAPALTSRRTRTRPAAARSRRGWCSRSSRASTGRTAAACASRTTS